MVVDDVAEARHLAGGGRDVVLIVGPDDDAPPVDDLVGRLAVFVGPVDRPETWSAAEVMAAELFGH